jgi:hypothetical protein
MNASATEAGTIPTRCLDRVRDWTSTDGSSSARAEIAARAPPNTEVDLTSVLLLADLNHQRDDAHRPGYFSTNSAQNSRSLEASTRRECAINAHFGVLGPLIINTSEPVEFAGARQRALARLLIQRLNGQV